MKNSQDDYEEEMRKIKEKHSRDNKDSSNNSDYNDSDKAAYKIARLKSDIEELKQNLFNPKLTEKEKVVIQEKLARFEKELTALENNKQNGSQKDDNEKNKERKSSLEDEINQLRKEQSENPAKKEEIE